MQFRSRMAALALVSGLFAISPIQGLAQGARRETPPSSPGSEKTPPKNEPRNDSTDEPTVELTLKLKVTGLSDEGCDVEIKPGNRGCRFKPQKSHLKGNGLNDFLFRDIEIRGADKSCAFAITIHETGQKPRTIYRVFRLAALAKAEAEAESARDKAQAPSAKNPNEPQTFVCYCYVNSSSEIAGLPSNDRATR